MLDRPASEVASTHASERPRSRWPLIFMGLAGSLGACGVAVGAAGAHAGGGDLARTASDFLLIHAAAVLAGSGIGLVPGGGPHPRLLAAALGLLVVGAILFGGELAVTALFGRRPFPAAAPVGGICLVVGWLCVSVCAAVSIRGRS